MRRALLSLTTATATTSAVRWRPARVFSRRRTLATQPTPQRVTVDEETGETVAVVSSSGTTWVRALGSLRAGLTRAHVRVRKTVRRLVGSQAI